MKYIEELEPGNAFFQNNKPFILTSDFKKNKSQLGYSLIDGTPTWFQPSEIVTSHALYYIDEINNVIPIKPIYNTPSNFS